MSASVARHAATSLRPCAVPECLGQLRVRFDLVNYRRHVSQLEHGGQPPLWPQGQFKVAGRVGQPNSSSATASRSSA